MAERIKCKPPKKIQVARAEPVRQARPQSGSTDDSDDDNNASRISSPVVEAPVDRSRFRRQPLEEPQVVDFGAPKKMSPTNLARPYDDDDNDDDDDLDRDDDDDKQTGTILLEPIIPPMEEIKAEPIQPIYVEIKKPLKGKCLSQAHLVIHH